MWYNDFERNINYFWQYLRKQGDEMRIAIYDDETEILDEVSYHYVRV